MRAWKNKGYLAPQQFTRDCDASEAIYFNSVLLSYMTSRTPLKQHESAPYSFARFFQTAHTNKDRTGAYSMLVSAEPTHHSKSARLTSFLPNFTISMPLTSAFTKTGKE
ncbi:hypothetical protein CONLIGDRAFT_143591 [Coniochaeta ligniaria NRRL 30616]|uniref:Uncharacterized protein n=1 Tax=Coniochaeta ligniaria NRRL 30616 TaxID=1408157 RepID=A0A1J7I6P7_9PEZI|nr:hypothetical protein CONLIGDRAFT_143591 [Coniochaeta ligniaria NRRL 30616]